MDYNIGQYYTDQYGTNYCANILEQLLRWKPKMTRVGISLGSETKRNNRSILTAQRHKLDLNA